MKEMETLTDTLIQPDKMNKKVSNILNKQKKKKKTSVSSFQEPLKPHKYWPSIDHKEIFCKFQKSELT
jgi:hypothetical protein